MITNQPFILATNEGTDVPKFDFFALTSEELQQWLAGQNLRPFIAQQLFHWVYKMRVFDVEAWSNVARSNRQLMKENLQLPRVLWHGTSSDGTRKFLIGLHDGQAVETVVIPAPGRLTICLSTQVGCAIGCTFCHTGTMGLKRHMTAGEIVGQLMAAQRWIDLNATDVEKAQFGERITNIVYMGQGEPLHNFDHTLQATKIFMEEQGLAFGQRKITLSTSGLVPNILRLSQFPPVNIAISLHAAHNDIRSELMPINKRYDLERLLAAIKTIPLKAHRYITYEYILIEGLNDRQADVDALISLLNKKQSKINIIPFNEYPGSAFKRPSNNKIKWFSDALNAAGLVTTVRATKGADILAACGQLKSEMDGPNLWQ